MAFQFVSRGVINYSLGEQYLGLSSLFTAVLQVLNMAELGFAGSIVYNMYKPLAEGDTETVCYLLAYYKKIYRTIGFIVLGSGAAVMPFVPNLIKGTYPSEINIYLLFGIYLVNTSISYFLFAYKTSLLEAVQRMDLSKLAYTIVNIIQYMLQVLALVMFKNYYLFVIFMVLGTAAKNIVAAVMANRYYPQYQCRGEITSKLKGEIITRVKGLLVCNISAVAYSTVDSIILSALIGLSSVAIYGNYVTVMSGVSNFVAIIRHSMQASVGNSVASESVEKNYNDMLLWQFLFSVIATWCVACMLSLYQPFMEMWMGKDLLLTMLDVVLICMWFNVSVVQHSFFLYLSGNGMWWDLRGPYIGSTVFNLTFNILLGKLFGITGIIFSSLLSSVLFSFIWQCNIIFKVYFGRTPIQFYKRQILYFIVSAVNAWIAFMLCSLIHFGGVLGLFARVIICTVVSAVVIAAAYFRTDISKRAVAFAKKVIKA